MGSKTEDGIKKETTTKGREELLLPILKEEMVKDEKRSKYVCFIVY